ncbi:hypothetical protein D3C81_1121420 [compost metagenome]
MFLDPAADAFFHLQQVDFSVQQRHDMLDTGSQVEDLEDFLLLLDLQRHVRSHGIDQAPWLVDAVERREDFSRDFFAQLNVLFKL